MLLFEDLVQVLQLAQLISSRLALFLPHPNQVVMGRFGASNSHGYRQH